MPDGTTGTGIGAAVKRVEDFRFLTGNGNYTDDINRPGQSYAYILRSPHAHARITSIDSSAAKAAKGVLAVFTGEDMQVGSLPCGWQIHSKDGSPMLEPEHPPLAKGKVRYVGDQVAVVIADTYSQAKDAAESIVVNYEVLPAAVSMSDALTDKVLIHDDVGSNLCFDWEIGDEAAVDEAMCKAAQINKIDLVNNRRVPNAMEPRAAVG